MKRKRLHDFATKNAKRAFSLVELLTVVAIITLLIAILVPAVNKVRETAKRTATQTTLSTLDTGLNMFRQDQQIGGLLPPSASDFMDTGGQLIYSVRNPHSQLTGNLADIEISGAGLLVWAMAGADLLGCPGFKQFGGVGSYWGQRTSDNPSASNLGAYAMNSTTREPIYARAAPFIDLSKVTISKWNPNAATQDGVGSFEIPAETETAEATQISPRRRNYPMFIDDFGGPILYWRADPAGKTITDISPTDPDVSGANRHLRGAFHYRDNADLLDQNRNPLTLTPKNENQRLFFNYPVLVDPQNDLNITLTDQNFAHYIRNANVTAKITPYNTDTFLLISAGPDGLFGTADDIANFPHGGAALNPVP